MQSPISYFSVLSINIRHVIVMPLIVLCKNVWTEIFQVCLVYEPSTVNPCFFTSEGTVLFVYVNWIIINNIYYPPPMKSGGGFSFALINMNAILNNFASIGISREIKEKLHRSLLFKKRFCRSIFFFKVYQFNITLSMTFT